MKAYWTDKRPNGQPIEAGTFARVIDLEDGTHPQWVYGATQEEVWQKIESTNMHAQQALARRAAVPATPAAPAVIPARMSPNDRMRTMAELNDPAKAGAAMAALIKDDTGFDPEQEAMNSWKRLAEEWVDETPGFYNHPGNRTLIARAAGLKVNGRVGLITKQMLNECFAALHATGELFEAPATPQNLETFPGESPVRRERERGARYATGIPGNRLGTPQNAQPKTLKYTKEDIERMPISKSRQLISSDDKEYAAACDFYFGTPQATA